MRLWPQTGRWQAAIKLTHKRPTQGYAWAGNQAWNTDIDP